MRSRARQVLVVSLALWILGCSTTYTSRPAEDFRPVEGKRVNPESSDGPGILTTEASDIISMSDQMVRDIIACADVAQRSVPPMVVVDHRYFRNFSSDRFDVGLITDRIRNALVRSATAGGRPRMYFVARHASDMVEHERRLKRDAVVEPGTQPQTARPAGADYRLGGSIRDLERIDSNGLRRNFVQFTFSLVNLHTGIQVWSGQYDYVKLGRDHGIYR